MKTSHFKFTKLYFPGLISLVGLPILITCYTLYSARFVTLRAMTMNIMDREWNMKKGGPGWGISKLPLRNFKNIDLNGDNKKDQQKIAELSNLMKRLVRNSDYVNGYKINFTSHTTYASMVNALDMCYQSKGVYIIPYKDNVYIYNFLHKQDRYQKTMPIFICGTGSARFNLQAPEITLGGTLTDFAKNIIAIWPALIFLVLMFVSHWYNTRQPTQISR